MNTHTLTTVEEALAYIAGEHSDDEIVKFAGALASFHAHIDGENYHASVPAGLARGLWELQEELYRAVAFALYGDESFKRLTEEQKEKYELVFQVSEGSSDLLAPLENFFKELGEGFKNMDSAHKMKTLIAIAVILAVAWGGVTVYQSLAESKQKIAEVEAESKDKQGVRDLVLAQEAAKTEQFKLIADIAKRDPVAGRFAKATENGTRAIIKGASDATHIKIGAANFNRDAIVEVNQRAAKEAAQAQIVTDEFRVVRGDARDGGVTRFWLVSPAGTEFSGIVIDEDFDAKGLNQLWEAFRGRSKLTLEINTTVVRGQIKNASILRVVNQPVSHQTVSSAKQAVAVAVESDNGQR
jgi:hypothetical protein